MNISSTIYIVCVDWSKLKTSYSDTNNTILFTIHSLWTRDVYLPVNDKKNIIFRDIAQLIIPQHHRGK